MEQLPGLATQDLTGQGYGFGPEGDWKIACLTAVMKTMAQGIDEGTALMEDYTYHFGKTVKIAIISVLICLKFAQVLQLILQN